MTRFRLIFVVAALLMAPAAFGGTYTLSDWCFYVNSLDINQSCNSGGGQANVPVATLGVTDLLHLQTDNTGTLTVTLAPGTYNIFAIFNYDINGSGQNEYAQTFGSLALGQVYSVNGMSGSGSSLTTQGAGGSFDNTNACTGSACSDVAVGLGYTNLFVPNGSTGTVTFTAGTTPPPSGFYVQQTDSLSDSINLSANVQISDAPEPGAMALMAGGLSAMMFYLRRRKA